jgi:mRNA interferase HigB
MRVIGIDKLDAAMKKHPLSSGQLKAWLKEAKAAKWAKWADLKGRYPSASLLNGNRVVFNIKGNKYRLLTLVYFVRELIVIDRFGTHAEYDNWNL